MTKTGYPLKLKDEVYVTRAGIHNLFKKKTVYAIGYGSLLFANGWKQRGMRTRTEPEDLIECTVNNYNRGPFGMHSGAHFYGAIPDKKQHFNAVLNRIYSPDDWEGLMQTELIAGMFKNYNYRVVDVTAFISDCKLSKNAVVHMVANEPINMKLASMCCPAPGYYRYVWQGVTRERTTEFTKEFLATGGYDFKGVRSLEITHRTMKYF